MFEASSIAAERKSGSTSGTRVLRISLVGSPGFHLGFTIFGALIATALGTLGFELLRDGLFTLLTFVMVVRALYLWSIARLRIIAVALGASLTVLAVLSAIMSGRVSGNHLYVVFIVTLVVAIELGERVSLRSLLRLTNAYYLVYLALSILVYLDVVDVGRSLNVFEATQRVPWLDFRTFVGFYGSTAHIDSISLFVALVNGFLGKGRYKRVIISLAVAASLGSVRFTPFVSFGIACLGTCLIGVLRRARVLRYAASAVIVLVIVASAPLSLIAAETITAWPAGDLINKATNGRLAIWSAMSQRFEEAPLIHQLFGTGTTDSYYLVGGWLRVHPSTGEVSPLWTANPHNSYLTVALNVGAVIAGLFGLVLVWLACQMRTWRTRLIMLYVLATGITNSELFTAYFPIYVVWIWWLASWRANRTGRAVPRWPLDQSVPEA